MKTDSKITIVEKHGQYYARWEMPSQKTADGKRIRKRFFQATGVLTPQEGSLPQEIKLARNLAQQVGGYLKELRAANPHAAIKSATRSTPRAGFNHPELGPWRRD